MAIDLKTGEFQTICCKYLGPTDTKPSRVKARTASGKSITLNWDDEHGIDGNMERAASSLIARMNWQELPVRWIGGQDQSGSYTYVAIRDQQDDILAALERLAKWATTGDKEGNPYCKPEIKDALKTIAHARGLNDWIGAVG